MSNVEDRLNEINKEDKKKEEPIEDNIPSPYLDAFNKMFFYNHKII